MDFSQYSGIELIQIHGDLLKEMKKQNLIRSKNVVGELGEHIVLDFYNKTKGIPNLYITPVSTKNYDAISRDGARYSIKCTTTNTTGTFWGLTKDSSFENTKQLFEYVIIIKLDEDFKPLLILEVNWDTFFKYKYWHTRMNAFNLCITNALINESKVIYKK